MFGFHKFATVFLTLALLACYNNGAPTGESAATKLIDANAPAAIKNEIAAHVETKEFQEDEQKAAASAENMMKVRLQPNTGEGEGGAGGGETKTDTKSGAETLVKKPEMFAFMLSVIVVKSFAAM